MKVIIAGGRDFADYKKLDDMCGFFIAKAILFGKVVIVSGKAAGADTLGEKFAAQYNLQIAEFPARWDEHGKAAGPIRNGQMAAYADMAFVFWDGQSRGSKNMIDTMIALKKPVIIIPY